MDEKLSTHARALKAWLTWRDVPQRDGGRVQEVSQLGAGATPVAGALRARSRRRGAAPQRAVLLLLLLLLLLLKVLLLTCLRTNTLHR